MKGLIKVRTDFTDYRGKINSDAFEFCNEYFDNLLEDLKNYNVNYHEWADGNGELHEWIDQHIDLREAVDILEQCDYEEHDTGLWEGLDVKEIISAMAFWSYKGDLMYNEIPKILEKMVSNEIEKQQQELEKLEGQKDKVEERLDSIDDDWEECNELEVKIEILEEDILEIETFIDNMERFISEMRTVLNILL